MAKVSKSDKFFLIALGKRIANIRKDIGLTQVQLGDRCDIEKPNMNRIEKGGTNPTTLTLKKICQELGISLADLFEDLGD